jgi:hypothetical protein
MVRPAGGIGFDPIANLNELHLAAPFRESLSETIGRLPLHGLAAQISSVPVSQAVLRFDSHGVKVHHS